MEYVQTFLACVGRRFPKFASRAINNSLEEVLPPVPELELVSLEERLGVPLPESYTSLLRCARGFWLRGGVVQLSAIHPFFHHFEPFERLSPQQQRAVQLKGGGWPPPSQGMLCFAEFFMEADGDQVLFDVSQGLVRGEYPVMYYSHESSPPSVRVLSDGFETFVETLLTQPLP